MSKRGISIEHAKKIRVKNGIEDTKLHKLRVKNKMSQSGLSVMSGVRLRTIQNYEQQTRQINGAHLDTLCRLCIALNCRIEDILEDKTLIERFKLCK